MSKLALYRKYRPQKFDDVLGQDHIVSILKNAIKLDRVSHAYLFSGSRGTGKTSVARILAKEMGCSEMDLVEVDAASSRGIDEIRALREAVHFVPLQGNVKVYIIDEVHMLTKEAFNALLKTLEEPPSHVVFILATTELEKVPETIISRCQNFNFRKISEIVLLKAIKSIAKNEGFEMDDESIGIVALLADGSFRDALGVLDQVLSLGQKKITGKHIREFFSVPSKELTENFITAIFKKDSQMGIQVIQNITEENIDINMFLKMVLRDIRAMLLLRLDPKMNVQLKEMLGENEFIFIDSNKDTLTQKELGNILLTLLNTYDTKSRSYLPQIPLELAFTELISNAMN